MLKGTYFDEELSRFFCTSHAFHGLCTVFNKWIRGSFHSDGLLRDSPCDFSLVVYLIEHRVACEWAEVI